MLTEQSPARSPYGRFPEVIERDWIGRWCHLSRADLDLVGRPRSDTTRLRFAVQLVTVRAIGTFLSEPADVPAPVVRSVADQIGVSDVGVLAGDNYEDSATRSRARWMFTYDGEKLASPESTRRSTST